MCNTAKMQSPQDFIRLVTDLWRWRYPQVGEYKFCVEGIDFGRWMLCDGRLLSVAEYPELAAVLGNAFGSAPSGSFYIPDARGRVVGIASTARPVGTSVGEETHTLTVDEMPTHNHTGTTDAAGLHNHGGVTGPSGSAAESETVSGGLGAVVAGSNSHTHSISQDGTHTHTFTTGMTGSSAPHNNMQPTIFLGNAFIYFGRHVTVPEDE